MRLLITGTGLIGSRIGEAIDREHELLWFDLEPKGDLRGDVVRGDLADYASVRRAMNGIDGVFHTAALHGIHMQSHAPTDFIRTNTLGTFNVLEAARDAEVGRVVVSSTTGAFGSGAARASREGCPPRITADIERIPGDVYGLSKYVCEDLTAYYRRKGLSAVALRYGGVRQLVNSVIGRVDVWWAANGMMTDVRDAVTANIAAMFMAQLPERVAHTILPTTLVDEDAVEQAGSFVNALRAAAPYLTDKHAQALQGRPVFLHDASCVQSELGIVVAHGQDEFLREAVGEIDPQ